ncbi:MAG TPA: response regulator [Caulobacteraceae bacterium]|jgi:CheY-like chemotaxis protein
MQPRILIVEDEWLIADLLEQMLTELGYEVVGPAADVVEALALIEERVPDAAVLDVSLAKGKSFAVADAMRDRGAPFLFLTGHVDGDLPPQYRSTPLICKPVLMSDLKAPLAKIAPTDGPVRCDA